MWRRASSGAGEYVELEECRPGATRVAGGQLADAQYPMQQCIKSRIRSGPPRRRRRATNSSRVRLKRLEGFNMVPPEREGCRLHPPDPRRPPEPRRAPHETSGSVRSPVFRSDTRLMAAPVRREVERNRCTGSRFWSGGNRVNLRRPATMHPMLFHSSTWVGGSLMRLPSHISAAPRS